MSIASINPATGEVLQTFDPLSDSMLELRLERAATAFRSFRRQTFSTIFISHVFH